MEKDPAFLMYSKDWLQGTASMTLEEKSIYIDLLCHQHQDGFIPNDVDKLARMTRMGIEDFKKAWETVSTKFQPKSNQKSTNGSVLVNAKLERVMNERTELAEKNRILGALSGLVRNAESDILKTRIRELFDFDEFKDYWHEVVNQAPTNFQPDVSQTLNQWLTKQATKSQPPLEDGDGDGIKDKDRDSIGGLGGKKGNGKIPDLEDFQKWTEQILESNDVTFEAMLMKDHLDLSMEAVKDHLSLLSRYPKMQPPTQQAFRYSLIKHMKEFKPQANGQQSKPKVPGFDAPKK